MLKRNILLSNLLLGLFLVTGCAKYKPQPFAPSFGEKKEDCSVIVSANTFSANDGPRFFSRNIQKKGYKAIQLTITNNSDLVYVLDGRTINLYLEPINFVSKDFHLDAGKRALWWIIPGIVSWPFLIVAAVDGIKSSNANSSLDRDFRKRCIDHTSHVEIYPHSTISKVMFVADENYTRKFSLKLGSLAELPNDVSFELSI